MRRALTNLGGPTRTEGDPAAAAILAEAMNRAATEDPDALTHGFHPWPARMHRAIAGVVIARTTQPGDRVVDPFCGSGTVLLEAMLADRKSAGVDLNPIAAELVKVKTDVRTLDERKRFLQTAILVGEASIERVQSREPIMAKLPPSMMGLYGVHTLKEMAGLLAEIRTVTDERARRGLEMVFSSLIVKVSNKRGETAEDGEGRARIRKGLVTEMFVRKCEELTERWGELADKVGDRELPTPRVFTGDSLQLREHVKTKVQLVLTSPPYGGTYDYHAQHALRLAWLGMDARALARSEIGARRRTDDDPQTASKRWDDEVFVMLRAMRDVIAPEGIVVLLMGDARFGRIERPLIQQLIESTPRAHLELVASASQPRPDWSKGRGMREEHLVMLRGVSRRGGTPRPGPGGGDRRAR